MSVDRRVLFHAAAGVVLVSLSGRQIQRQGFQPQMTVAYQVTPKDGRRCSGCKLYVPAGDISADGRCSVVAGVIKPSGWCVLHEIR